MSDRWEAVWEIEGGFGGTRNNQCLSQDDRSADGDQNERRQGVAAPLSGATSDPAKISGLEGSASGRSATAIGRSMSRTRDSSFPLLGRLLFGNTRLPTISLESLDHLAEPSENSGIFIIQPQVTSTRARRRGPKWLRWLAHLQNILTVRGRSPKTSNLSTQR